jgi:hypothetical protein
MRDVHVISLLALAYAVVLSLVSFIFFRDYALWAVLGSLTALFNHSQIIRITKGKYDMIKLGLHIAQRYALYVIIITLAFLRTRDANNDIMTRTFVFLLLGFIAVKVGVLLYATPLINKKNIISEEGDEIDGTNH